jgi:hypothetical protein
MELRSMTTSKAYGGGLLPVAPVMAYNAFIFSQLIRQDLTTYSATSTAKLTNFEIAFSGYTAKAILSGIARRTVNK